MPDELEERIDRLVSEKVTKERNRIYGVIGVGAAIIGVIAYLFGEDALQDAAEKKVDSFISDMAGSNFADAVANRLNDAIAEKVANNLSEITILPYKYHCLQHAAASGLSDVQDISISSIEECIKQIAQSTDNQNFIPSHAKGLIITLLVQSDTTNSAPIVSGVCADNNGNWPSTPDTYYGFGVSLQGYRLDSQVQYDKTVVNQVATVSLCPIFEKDGSRRINIKGFPIGSPDYKPRYRFSIIGWY